MKTHSALLKITAIVALVSSTARAFAWPRPFGPRGPRVVVPVRPGPFIPVPVRSPVAPSSAYRTAIAVQRALAARGYYQGEIDGDIGQLSRRAIVAYQGGHGKVPAGDITTGLLRSLGI